MYSSQRRRFADGPEDGLKVIFQYESGKLEDVIVDLKESDGSRHRFATFADVAKAHDVDMDLSCGGNAACSTCHVYLAKEDY